MSVQCNRCGQRWPRDPALEVPCPKCWAGVGQHCRRPSGHNGPMVHLHPQRDVLAMARGYLQRCPGAQQKAS